VTISEDTIKNAVLRYHREYDRYLKLSARVAEICRFEIVEGNAIRAQVTFRAKSPKSLEGKLRRFTASGKKNLSDAQSVFDEVRDLAAVRIATYEQRHEDQVVQLVCKRFVDPKGAPPAGERKDKNAADHNNFYRATHIEAFLPEADVIGTYANVSDVPCEIQVCSMMAHVWNEIEHDLGYKPLTGSLSDQERNFLVMLGHAVRQGDMTIGSLFAETERRQRGHGGVLTDVYDFVARVRGWFPDIDFGRNAGPLYEALQPVRLVSPESIRKLIAAPEPMTVAAAQTALDEFSAKLVAKGDARFALDRNFSDLLLVLLLPKVSTYIVSSSGEAVSDGVARLRWFAARFQELSKVESGGLS
jgi:ppGpp synthetase/RelA/SpoT-type nucleotidyltranferase